MYHLVDQCWKDNRIFLIKRYLVTLRGRRKWLSTIDLPLGDLPFNSDPLWRERAVFHARFMLHVYSSRAPFAQGIVFIESSLWIDHYLNVPLEEGRRCSLIRFSGFDVTNLPPSLSFVFHQSSCPSTSSCPFDLSIGSPLWRCNRESRLTRRIFWRLKAFDLHKLRGN